MSDAAVIAGSFADYRLVKSRGVIQVVVEIPVERQAEVFAALGYPMPGTDIPVAVARLARQPIPPPANQEGTAAIGGSGGTDIAMQPAGDTKQRRPFHTLPPAQRAALLCQDARFRDWIAKRDGSPWSYDETDAASWLRSELSIQSRADIAANPHTLRAFERIETAYMQDTGLLARAG